MNPYEKSDPVKYYKIPVEYTPDKGSCTPRSIQYDKDATTSSTCPEKERITNTTKDISKGIANLNIDAWVTHVNAVANTSDARFFLLRMLESNDLQFDLSMYEHDTDLVVYRDGDIVKINRAKNVLDKVNKYTNDTIPNVVETGKFGPGSLTSHFGVCNSFSYKLGKFARRVGVWILLLLFLALFAYIIWEYFKHKNKSYSKIQATV